MHMFKTYLYHNPQILAIFSTRYSIMCKVYTGFHGTSEMEHGLCTCTVNNPLAIARGLSLCTGAQTMLYLSQMFYLQLQLVWHNTTEVTVSLAITSTTRNVFRKQNLLPAVSLSENLATLHVDP